MHRVNTAAGFVYANMPLGLPYSLTPKEAWDVAAYINSHERPADPRQSGKLDLGVADERYHEHDGFYADEIDGRVIGGGVQGAPSRTPSVVPAH